MRAFLRIAAITTATGLLLAPAASMASAASVSHPAAIHAASVHLTSGETSLTTVSGLTETLLESSISLFATSPGEESLSGSSTNPQLELSFPVSGGRVNPSHLTGTIKHRGGILFINTSNSDTLKLSRIHISLTRKHLSAIVSGTRVTIADLSFFNATVRVGLSHAKVRHIRAKLTTAGADALNAALGVSLFAEGERIATVRTLVRF